MPAIFSRSRVMTVWTSVSLPKGRRFCTSSASTAVRWGRWIAFRAMSLPRSGVCGLPGAPRGRASTSDNRWPFRSMDAVVVVMPRSRNRPISAMRLYVFGRSLIATVSCDSEKASSLKMSRCMASFL